MSKDERRERYERAILGGFSEATQEIDTGVAADAAMAVADKEMDKLKIENARLRAHR